MPALALDDAFQNPSALHDWLARYIFAIAPQDIENVVESRCCRLFLKALKEVKAEDSIFVNGNHFAVQDRRRNFRLESALATVGNFFSRGKPFLDQRWGLR